MTANSLLYRLGVISRYWYDNLFFTDVTRILAAAGAVALFPFGIYHLLWSSTLVAALALVLCLIQLLMAIFVSKRKDALLAAHLLVMLNSIAGLAVMWLLGMQAAYWMFVVISVNYYLLPLRSALAISVMVIAGSLPIVVSDPQPGIRYLVSVVLVSLLAGIFSLRSQHQKADMRTQLYLDPLTGALNRRAMDAEIKAVLELRRRYQTPVCALVLDLDHFKRVNDQFGHQTGDEVLVKLVDTVRSRLRINDQLFRFGGEEFVVITRNTGLAGAMLLAENIRRRIEIQEFAPVSRVTVSVGVAELIDDESPDCWLQRADDAMYEAKRQGRNQVWQAAVDTSGDVRAVGH